MRKRWAKRRWLARLAGAFLMAFGSIAMAAAQVPIDAFFTHHGYTQPVLSPSGRYLAVIGPDPNNANRNLLDIIDLKQMKVHRSFSLGNREIFYRFKWKSDDRMVLSTAIRTGGFDKPFATGKIYVVDVPGSGLRLLQKNVSWKSYTGYRIIDPLWDDPGHVITASFSRVKVPHAYLLDLRHDMTTVAARGRGDNLMAHAIATSPLANGSLMADNAGHVRIALGYDRLIGARLWSYRAAGARQWKPMPPSLFDPAMGAKPVGFTPDNKSIYLLEYGDSGAETLGLYRFNADADKKKLLFADPVSDVADVMYGPDHDHAVALTLMPGRPKIVLLHQDGRAAKILKAFSAGFPNEFPKIVSWSRDSAKAIVDISSARDPGRFYLVDTDTLKAQFLFKELPSIDPKKMARVKPIKFKARDGMIIHGYLTLPRGKQQKDLPMIVFVHGGPFNVRDT